MKVIIVNCFDTYEDRIELIYDFFMEKGHDLTIIQSDFKHFNKVKCSEKKQDYIFVESRPYHKNMSLSRLISHYIYSKNAFKLIEHLKPDLLFVLIPPNSLSKFAAQYKKKHKNVKLIFDLIDLWPEAIPVGNFKVLPIFNFWKLMRDKNLNYSDYVITECDFYQEVLKKQLRQIKTKTIHLAKKEIVVKRNLRLSNHEIHLCYLGSINHIIDIQKITQLIKLINKIKPVTLHIIGDGESKDLLVSEVKNTGAIVEEQGKLYDPQKKQAIFDQCHFGINMMKNMVCVGLTMKSIDYFQGGIPIINSICGDTLKMVENLKIGMNVTDTNMLDMAKKIGAMRIEEFLSMRKNTFDLFNSSFSVEVFNKKLEEVVKEL